MKPSRRFVGFYLSCTLLSTIGYLNISDGVAFNETFDWLVYNVFYNSDSLLISIYTLYYAYSRPELFISKRAMKLYGYSYLTLFVLFIISSFAYIYDYKYELITSFFVHSVRAFHLVLFLYLGGSFLKKSNNHGRKNVILFLTLEVLLALSFNYLPEADSRLLGVVVIVLLLGLWVSAIYANRMFDRKRMVLAVAVAGIVFTEIYYALIYFEKFSSFSQNLTVMNIFRLLGSLFELWALSILLRFYWPESVRR